MRVARGGLATLITVTVLAAQSAGWIELKQRCPGPDGGCGPWGNCGADGKCQCLMGWTGPACEAAALGPCRSRDAPGVMPWAPGIYPKSCECFLRMRNWLCGGDLLDAALTCHVKALEDWGNIRCFVRDGVPAHQQFSEIPEPAEPGVTWYKPTGGPLQPLVKLDPQPSDYVKFGGFFDPDNRAALPLTKCPSRCKDRGICTAFRDKMQESRAKGQDVQGTCQCHYGYQGPDCGYRAPTNACMGNCSNVGECMGGSCKCPPGRFGMDCSRTRAFAPDPSKPMEVEDKMYARRGARIFRYEIPWHIAFPWELEDTIYDLIPLYSGFKHFWETLINDTEVRTENPWEANLFYIPALTLFRAENCGDPHPYITRIIDYVRETYPQFWSRHEGRDHILWIPGDIGACWLQDLPHVQNPIKIVHFGMQLPIANYTGQPGYKLQERRAINREYGCFKREKDVVAPPFMGANDIIEADAVVTAAAASGALAAAEAGCAHISKELTPSSWVTHSNRTHLLYFGGGIREQQVEYSGGARQAFAKYVLAEEKYKSLIKFGGAEDAYRQAIFCLAPYGDGWGSRLPHIMIGGCIPVIVQDFVHQFLDDVLPYPDFAIRLRHADIPLMMEILQRIPPEQVLAMQCQVLRYRKAFIWQQELGGRAYNYTIQSLQRKLSNLHAMFAQT